MIFSEKVFKIPSGKNISLYAEDENNITMFIFTDLTEEKTLELSPTIKCRSLGRRYGYHMVIKLNDKHKVICFDKNISVTQSQE